MYGPARIMRATSALTKWKLTFLQQVALKEAGECTAVQSAGRQAQRLPSDQQGKLGGCEGKEFT